MPGDLVPVWNIEIYKLLFVIENGLRELRLPRPPATRLLFQSALRHHPRRRTRLQAPHRKIRRPQPTLSRAYSFRPAYNPSCAGGTRAGFARGDFVSN
jgi:hypothetical protein